jgi:thiosulfate/3-mercaptopyruvate sulfurtransferase
MNKPRYTSLCGLFALTIVTFSTIGSAKPWVQGTPQNWPTMRTISPIVSTEWLSDNANRNNLVVVDIRPDAAYQSGHIPKSLSAPLVVPFSAWLTMADDLLLEVPPKTELFATLGSLGITPNSWVVVVTEANAGEPFAYGFANATRVADTLIYAGVANVAVLNGGYPQWVADGGQPTTSPPFISPTTYNGQANDSMFVSTEYVAQHMWKAGLIDARDPDVYFGRTVEPFAAKAGHIPTAKSLPTPWLWDTSGAYVDFNILNQMAWGAAGWHKGRELIVYCGVGGYASSWWFVLTQVLGYRNVKLYDGSAQDWVKTHDMVAYRWE